MKLVRMSALVLASCALGLSSAWSAQFGLTATQARNIAKFKSVAVLVGVNDGLIVRAPGEVCDELKSVENWGFAAQTEEIAAKILSDRFSVVPKGYHRSLMSPGSGFLGQISRDALPPGDDVDAFVILYGGVDFVHAAGLPAPGSEHQGAIIAVLSAQLTLHDPEVEYVTFGIDIIDAKSQRTVARKEIPTGIGIITEGFRSVVGASPSMVVPKRFPSRNGFAGSR